MYKTVLVLFCLVFVPSLSIKGYYWRDYTGIIPEDAYPGGEDFYGNATYIGIQYLPGAGVLPITMRKEFPSMFRWTETFLEILCTENPKSMKWIYANKTDFARLTKRKKLVRGGFQSGNWLHIGRVNYQGELIIGRILSGRSIIGDAVMSFDYNEKEQAAYIYEVLSYDPDSE